MKKKYKIVLALGIAVLILPSILQFLIFSFSGGSGSFGLRPATHRCIGFEVDSKTIINSLPSADIDFHILLFHFNYRVDQKDSDWDRFCLGQDIWFGE